MNQQTTDVLIVATTLGAFALPYVAPRLRRWLDAAGGEVDRQLVLEPDACGSCDGTGYVATVENGQSGYRFCRRCRGTGRRS